MPSRSPFPVPFGWFQLGFSRDFPESSRVIKPYFGRHLCFERAASGVLRASDIEEGRDYPIVERYGWVLAWHHPQGLAPLYEAPAFAEFEPDAAGWSDVCSSLHVVENSVQEMGENGVDGAHFQYVHSHPGVADYDDMQIDEHVLKIYSKQKFPGSRGEVEGRIDVENIGMGFTITRYQTLIRAVLAGIVAPVHEEQTELNFHFRIYNPDGDERTARIGEKFIASVNHEVGEDTIIWNHKIYRERPALCDGDGPIARYRKFAAQFYV